MAKNIPKPEKASPRIRLSSLKVSNFRALDHLELEFPAPRMVNDPDVFVLGSRNGLGKTSVLECCSFLFLASREGPIDLEYLDRSAWMNRMPLMDLIVRAGEQESTITGEFTINEKRLAISVHVSRKRQEIYVDGDTGLFKRLVWGKEPPPSSRRMTDGFLRSVAGMNSEPLVIPSCMYFHSYRKVQEGNLDLGVFVDRERSEDFRRQQGENVISTFKSELLLAMMSKQGLFENPNDAEPEDVLDVLQDLVSTYAGGRVEKLRPGHDNTLEFRVSPNDGRPPFTFDGLSSGQKEIISTLFLIWRHTHSRPGIVLIDEPELHLNAEWHKLFVEQLARLVPHNQYILATHSVDVFGSVPESHRMLLVPDGVHSHA